MPACRSCGAPIRWARTAAGKAMPLDAEPTSAGTVQLGWIGGQETAIVVNPAAAAAAIVDGQSLYVPHHATCPQAAAWRRAR